MKRIIFLLLFFNLSLNNFSFAGQLSSKLSSKNTELEDPKNFTFRKKFFGPKNTFEFLYFGTMINLRDLYRYSWTPGTYNQSDHQRFTIQTNYKLGCFLETIKDLRELELSDCQSCVATFLHCLPQIETSFHFEKLHHLIFSYAGYGEDSFRTREKYVDYEHHDFHLLTRVFLERAPILNKITIKDRYPQIALKELAKSPHMTKVIHLVINCRGRKGITNEDFSIILTSPYFKNLKSLSVAGYSISKKTLTTLEQRFGKQLSLLQFYN